MRSSRSNLAALRYLPTRPLRTQALVIEAAALVCASRLLVKYVPFRLWRDRLGALVPASDIEPTPIAFDEAESKRAKEIGRIVARTARRMPFKAACLPQAMAACWMLRRRGLASTLFIGAAPGAMTKDPTQLHAWLQAGGLCITGAREMQEFTPVIRFASRGSERIAD